MDISTKRLLGGKYFISMGTAMIFESSEFDIRKWPNLMYLNLRTLYRNYVASIPTDYQKHVKVKDMLEDFFKEVSTVETIIKEVSQNRVKILFYYPRYEHLDKVLPEVTVLDYNPGIFDQLELDIWAFAKRNQMLIPFFYQEVKGELPPANEPVLLLSSFITDLLSASRFPALYLIESFTGKIKKRQEWHTKLKIGNVKNIDQIGIPFNKFTIQVFGDKSGAYKGQDRVIRKVVREMAINDHWSPITTRDKIRTSINKLKDHDIKKILLDLL